MPPWLLVFPCCSGQSLLINHSGLYNCNPPRPPICIYLNSLKAEALFTYPQPLKAGLMLRLSKCSEGTEHSGEEALSEPLCLPAGVYRASGKGAKSPEGKLPERSKQLQERVSLSPCFLSLLQKGEKEHQHKPAKSSLMHLTFQKKINSNFTPTGCVAQLCQKRHHQRGDDKA